MTDASLPSGSEFITQVMVVDDSAVIRGMVTRILEKDPSIKVVASAPNGEIAVSLYSEYKPDVVILDIEMPVMDGLTALGHIIKLDPKAKIIMCSTLTLENAEISIRAMALGAVDYVPKPTSTSELNTSAGFHERIVDLVRSFGKVRPRTATAATTASKPATAAIADALPVARGGFTLPPVGASFTLRAAPNPMWRPRILAVGSSTGGPQALFEFLKPLKGIKNIPIVITQHMPATFTALLAQHITTQTGIECVEAADGMPLLPGRAHLAKGGLHMLVRKNDQGQLCLALNDGPQENFCKPAVDPMLRSLIPFFSRDILTVILTGMGSDGMLGSKAVVEAGGYAAAQDQATSVVWGMPGATAMAGVCYTVLPIKELGVHVARKVLP